MKNNKGLIITLIIVFSICAICLSVLLGFILVNKKSFRIMRFDFVSKTEKIYDERFAVSDISKINIYSSSSDITIKEANTNEVEIRIFGKNKNAVRVNHSNDTLRIDYTNVSNCIGFCFYREDIEILIPHNYQLDGNIESKYGDINIGYFDNGKLVIDSDSGDIDIKSIKDIEIKSHYGDILIAEVKNKLDIKSNSGDIEISRVNILENSKIVSDYGDVEIDKINDIYVDAKTNFGDVDIDHNNRYAKVSLVIDSSYGDIEVGD